MNPVRFRHPSLIASVVIYEHHSFMGGRNPRGLRGRSETALRLEEEWMDEKGLDPIGLPGVLYGLSCIED